MTLKYKIEFFDYWHLSSGLSAGAKLDSSVVKDDDGLPYAPAKTIKGLAREMVEIFGDSDFLHQCYFANAVLDKESHKEIVSHKLQDNLYDVIASTKIGIKDKFDKQGKQIEAKNIAVDDSLRETEVVMPLTLYGEILDVLEEDCEKLEKALKTIKRMGLNRNRGLGRCEFKEISCMS